MYNLPKYDFIIGGAGLAGLTLAWKIMDAGLLKHKNLLIIDRDKKNTNDRTWCFWAKPDKWLNDLPIYKSWQNACVKGKDFNFQQSLQPYQYYKIEGIDYYNFIFDKLREHSQITIIQDVIVSEEAENKIVKTQEAQYHFTDYFFKSYFIADELSKIKDPKKHFIWQHFLGWKIKSKADYFDPESITYMDMRVPKVNSGLSFGYILPESKSEALVEYTLFSADLWKKAEYEEALKHYIENTLNIQDYEIEEEEFNKIPMTNTVFEQRNKSIIPIGTLAGTVKPSTGYSFVRNYHHIQLIVKNLKNNNKNFESAKSKRFRFYDEVLMNVLITEKSSGHEVFGKLYKGNTLAALLKFLNEETSLWEDLKIMNTVPKWAFIKAVAEEISPFSARG
ncbi:MAG: lycopene cyclase family protein [Bacteroidota bacterium]